MAEPNSLVSKGCNVSNYLKMEILKQCKYKTSFKTIAQQLNKDFMTVINTFMKYANFERRKLTEIICVDEFSAIINYNNAYTCIIGERVNNKIIDILHY